MGYGIRKIKNSRKSGIGKMPLIVAGLVVLVGLPLVLFSLQQKTVTQQHASVFNDLNTSSEITSTINADGTMGPADYLGDLSKTMPEVYLGTLNIQVTDPPQAAQNGLLHSQANSHNPNIPTIVPNVTNFIPTQAQGFLKQPTKASSEGSQGDEQNKGDTHTQSTTAGSGPTGVIALNLTISKAEVHVAHLGLPGSKNENVTPTPVTPTQGATKHGRGLGLLKSNQDTDKWETLNIPTPQTIDIVQLATSHSLAPLCLTKLVNGRYTEIRLYISTATAKLQDGSTVTLTIPGRNNIVRIIRPFVINSSKTTTLTIDFDAQNSVVKAGDQYILKPVVAKMNNQTQE